MSKLSKEDLLKKVSEKVEDSDIQLELIEDISDSFEVDSDSVSKEEYDNLNSKYNDLTEKYKSRFLDVKEEKKETKETKEDITDEPEVKNYVDVKDI